jgi:hypothetical protein
MSNSPRRTPKRTLAIAPPIPFALWAKRQAIINDLARKG